MHEVFIGVAYRGKVNDGILTVSVVKSIFCYCVAAIRHNVVANHKANGRSNGRPRIPLSSFTLPQSFDIVIITLLLRVLHIDLKMIKADENIF